MSVEKGTQKLVLPSAGERFVAGGLFDQATRYEALFEAWEKVRANNGSAGGDGVPIERFQRGAEGRLSRLSHELRTGRYAPSPVRRVLIPKPAGGMRPLDIPSIVDRVAQAAVAGTLMPVLEPEMEASSFAYRPGRSVAQAVARVMSLRREGYVHVVDGDIVRYFERVPHGRLIARLERSLNDNALIDLIGLWLEHHSHTETGLPQGSPLSPLLANIYLDDIDEAIEGRGMRLVRFADDFLILCRSEAIAGDALVRMARLLETHGLELHPEKSRIVDFDRGFRFLGHVFVKGMVWKDVIDDTPAEDAVAAAESAGAKADMPEEPVGAARLVPDEPLPARGRYAARQRVAYLIEPGRALDAEGESFVVREGDSVLTRIPCRRIDRFDVAAGIAITVDALDLAAASEIVIQRVDGFGRVLGRWSGPDPARAALRLAQAGAVLDPYRRLALAREIVAARVFNQRALLKRMSRARADGETAVATQKLNRIRRAAALKLGLDIPALMGHEGEAAALFWPAAARLLERPDMFAGKRRRREGLDPLNAVLDLLSSLLARDMTVAIERAGLEPGFGVLHASEDGVEALAFDLMEAFRAPIVEACAFASLGRKAIGVEDFERWGTTWRLTRAGHAATIRAYEAWVQRPIRSPRTETSLLWRGLMEEEARAFGEACMHNKPFAPYLMDF